MNNTITESVQLVEGIKKSNLKEDVEVVVAVPFTSLSDVKKAIEGTRINWLHKICIGKIMEHILVKYLR